MRFAFIRDHTASFEVTIMLRVLNVSKSGFYAWLKRLTSLEPRKTRCYSRRSKQFTKLPECHTAVQESRLHSGTLGLESRNIAWHDSCEPLSCAVSRIGKCGCPPRTASMVNRVVRICSSAISPRANRIKSGFQTSRIYQRRKAGWGCPCFVDSSRLKPLGSARTRLDSDSPSSSVTVACCKTPPSTRTPTPASRVSSHAIFANPIPV